jgi:hypothetical protein
LLEYFAASTEWAPLVAAEIGVAGPTMTARLSAPITQPPNDLGRCFRIETLFIAELLIDVKALS